MTDIYHAIILAIIQGLTEFLPISSSAHLILPAQLLGWPDQGLVFDVAVHVGSLLAVVIYFRSELITLAAGGLRWVSGQGWNEDAAMILWLALATVPAGMAGLLLGDFIEANLRSMLVIAVTTIVFGLLLGWADARAAGGSQLSLKTALIIGAAQTLAVIPGTSRSGITITAGLFCGLSRETAARFSFLLSIPIIAAAGLLQTLELATQDVGISWTLLATATAVSGLTAFACIAFFLRVVERIGFMPFVIYRLVLGLFLIYVWW